MIEPKLSVISEIMKSATILIVCVLLLGGCDLLGINSGVSPLPTDTLESNDSSVDEVSTGGEKVDSDNKSAEASNSGLVTVDEEPVSQDTRENIEAAFARKHPDWEMDSVNITVDIVDGDYIAGGAGPAEGGPGGGYFYAAKTESGEWVIAADGNGAIMCDDIEPYDFPVEMISQCYDEDLGREVERED